MRVTLPNTWLHVIDPQVLPCLPGIRHALFDFDGTLSVLREGWEGVMVPLMVEMICGASAPTPEIEAEVGEYVDRSTGILTIEQMGWLVEAVRRHNRNGAPLSAAEYKAVYLQRLLVGVAARVEALVCGQESPQDRMVAGSREFLQALQDRGVTLYLASGTDHADVVREAQALGLAGFFGERIYGALDANQAHNKSQVIQKILAGHSLGGPELMVVGDGPVEIREAVVRNAIALGVASDEIKRRGWNEVKINRLAAAGAHLIIPDFTGYQALL